MAKKIDENKEIDAAVAIKKLNERKQWLNEQRQLAMQSEAEKLRDKGFISDGKGGKISLRDQWRQEVKNTIEQDVNSYHDWRAAILGLIKMYSSFVSTNQQLIQENVYLPAKHLFLNLVGYPLNDAIVDALCGPPEVALPALLQLVEMDDNGHLSVDVSRSDGGSVEAKYNQQGQQVEADLNQLLRQGVASWLNVHGYQFERDRGVFVKDNEVLTKDTFDKLKNDAHLDDYLSEHYSSDIRPRP